MASLKIVEIRIKDFKSFYGESIISGLDEQLTTIIGPNGSGKSNILDSILFVLGFRAKKMRHSQQTNLIYRDGEVQKDMCYVEIVFKKGDELYNVRRELYQNKKNKYFMNDRETRADDLQHFFALENVDLESNRFLILQGEIESIAMMKPKKNNEKTGFLEYLEEIIGTMPFNGEIDKKTEELTQLKELNDFKLTSFNFYSKEFELVKKRKTENEEKIKATLNFLNIKNAINILSSKKMFRNVESHSNQRVSLQNEIEQNKAESEKMVGIMNIESEKVAKMRTETKKLEGNLLAEKKYFEKIDLAYFEYKNKKKKFEKNITRLSNEIQSHKDVEIAIRADQTNLKLEIKSNISELNDLNIKSSNIAKESAGIEEHHKETIATHKLKIKDMQSKLKTLLEKKEKGFLRENELESKVKDSEELKSSLTSQKNMYLEETKKIEALSAEYPTKEAFEKAASDNQSSLNVINVDIEATLKELQKRKICLRDISSRNEKNTSSGNVDEALKGISGVFGRVKDLGSVEDKYEVAISAASKGVLNNIVVDTTATAEKCAEIIRKRGLVRTTFIIIEAIADIPNLKREKNLYCYELIKTEAKFKKCFFYALKDCLIAENIEEANSIAFGKTRKRVVTFDGKLIEKSGLMSSAERQNISLNKSKKYEEEIKKLENALNHMNKTHQALKATSEKLEILRTGAEKTLIIKKQLNETVKKISDIKVNIRDIEELSSIKNDMREVDIRITKLKSQIEHASDTIANIYGERYKELRATKKEYDCRARDLECKIDSKTRELEMLLIVDYHEKELELKDFQLRLSKLVPVIGYEENKTKIDALEKIYKEKHSLFEVEFEKLSSIKVDLKGLHYKNLEIENSIAEINKKLANFKECTDRLAAESVNIVDEINFLGAHINIAECCPPPVIDKIENLQEIDNRLKDLEKTLSTLTKIRVDFNLLKEFSDKREEFMKVKNEFEAHFKVLSEKQQELNLLVDARLETFMVGYEAISQHLKEIYQTVTFGGNAELELVDCMDPFTEGVVLSVMPPKKSWKNINNLSGGEKTLASLSFVFALHMYKPSPFYIMDEIDAALDFRNVSVIANFLKEQTSTAQFIVISLRSDMFELSNKLVGVYKNENHSKLILVDTNEC